jgi:hypothetical protein
MFYYLRARSVFNNWEKKIPPEDKEYVPFILIRWAAACVNFVDKFEVMFATSFMKSVECSAAVGVDYLFLVECTV